MKRFVQVSLISAAILFGIGAILGMIGILGNHHAVKKEVEEAFSENGTLQSTLVQIDSHVLGTNLLDSKGNEITSVSGQKSYPADEIQRLDLELGAGTFTIEESSEQEAIEVLWTGKGKVRCEEKAGTLTITAFDGNGVTRLIGGYGTDSQNQLTIRLPKGKTLSEIVLEGGAGTFEVKEVVVERLKLEGGAGEFKLNDLTVEELKLEVGAGRLEATELNAGEVELSVGMGDATIQGRITGDVTLECGMGNVVMELTDRQEDHNYEIEAAAGNVKIGEEASSALATEKSIQNGADNTWKIECGMGNIEIQFEP